MIDAATLYGVRQRITVPPPDEPSEPLTDTVGGIGSDATAEARLAKPGPYFFPSFSLGIGGVTILKGGSPTPTDEPAILESWFGVNNPATSTIDYLSQPSFKADPEYTPDKILEQIGGVGSKYEAYHLDQFIGSVSAEDTAHRMSLVDRRDKRHEVISRSGWRGVVANIAAGVLDPANALTPCWVGGGGGGG